MGFAEARAAFVAGRGEPGEALAAFRSELVWMPVDGNGRVFTLMFGGLAWLVAFTSVARLRDWMMAVGADVAAGRMFSAPGALVIDELMDGAPSPTALLIDAASAEPFTFAPVKGVSPHMYVDVASGQAVTVA